MLKIFSSFHNGVKVEQDYQDCLHALGKIKNKNTVLVLAAYNFVLSAW